MNLFWVGLGGALGSMARYLLGMWVQSLGKGADFPWGTLSVNLLGCLVIGALAQWSETRGATAVFLVNGEQITF